MSPTVILAGSGAADYLDTAISLHQQGRRGRFLVDEVALLLLSDRDLKIIMLASAYAIFTADPVTSGMYPFFPFFDDAVPEMFPAPAGPLPVMPLFFPVYPDELLVPSYAIGGVDYTDANPTDYHWRLKNYSGYGYGTGSGFKVYIAGAATPYRTVIFLAPIASSHDEYLSWQKIVMAPQAARNWLLMTYWLSGYLNPNDLAIQGKLLIYDASVTAEYNVSAPLLHVVSLLALPALLQHGIFYRRLKTADQPDKIVMYWHDGSYCGTLYDLVEVEGSLYVNPLPVPPLPPGQRLWSGHGATDSDTARRIDYTYDLFTSERAQHCYLVRSKIDSFVNHHAGLSDGLYDANGSDTYIYAGMSLAVEKRRKDDWSLVETYNLTPAAIDQVLQGFPDQHPAVAPEVIVNANGCINASGTINGTLAIITRFVSQGGYVLVGEDGAEYPILAGVSLSQDLYNESGTDANLFCQAVLLWLGAPPAGFDCWTWDGVDAAGLKVTESRPGLMNDQGIGLMRNYGGMPGIGDSDRIMLCLEGFYSDNTFTAIPIDSRSVSVKCAHLGHGRSFADDRQGVTAGDRFYLDGTLVYTIVDANAGLAATVAAIMAGINGAGSYVASDYTGTTENGAPVATFTLALPAEVEGEISVALAYRSVWGYGNQRRVVSARLVDGVPVVRLEKTLPQDQPIYMFDI